MDLNSSNNLLKHNDSFNSNMQKLNKTDEMGNKIFKCDSLLLPPYVKDSVSKDCASVKYIKDTNIYTIDKKNGTSLVMQPPYYAGRKTRKYHKNKSSFNRKRKSNKRRKFNKRRKH